MRELAMPNSHMAALDGRMASLDDRMTSLDRRIIAQEEKVDARLSETRLISKIVLSRLDVMDAKLNVPRRDLQETRAETDLLKKRLPPAA